MTLVGHINSNEEIRMKARKVTGKASALAIEKQPKDRPFNGFRIAKTTAARTLVNTIVAVVESFEAHHQLRSRARRAVDQTTFERQIEAVICDAAYHAIMKPDAWLAISFSKTVLGRKDRYRPSVLRETLPEIVRILADQTMQFVELQESVYSPFNKAVNRQTTIRAGARLLKSIADHNLSVNDFGIDQNEEVIILKATKEDHFDKGKWIQYEDTPQTHVYREQMRRINDWLEKADIDVGINTDQDKVIDATNRRLRRYFNNSSFEQGGRLYGGFWIDMGKQERLDRILIEDTQVVELDYGQMMARMLYGWAKVKPHFEDAYMVPGLEHWRDGVKKLFSSMVHAGRPLSRRPKGTRALLPTKYAVSHWTDLIKEFHAPIAQYFHADIGLHQMYQESEILLTVLDRLVGMGITALPIHDAVLVAEVYKEQATEVMLDVFRETTGIEGVVRKESA